MKRIIFCLLSVILLFPLFSQGVKEEDLGVIKDEIMTSRPYVYSSIPLTFEREDEIVKNEILNRDIDDVSSSLTVKYSSLDGNATVEYSSTYLYYSLFLLDDNVELKVTEDGVSLYLNNELVGEKTLSDNILLFEKALSDITQILSYPDNFKVTEIKKYYGENWETTLCWPLEEREIKVEIEYIDTNNSLWFISGNIEKDKINDTFTPLNIFSTPYFVLNEVKKDGEVRNKGLW